MAVVATVETVMVATDDVMLVRARRAVRPASSLLNSVVDTAVAVVVLLLPKGKKQISFVRRILEAWLIFPQLRH